MFQEISGTLIVILPFFLTLFFLTIAVLYSYKIRKVYPHLVTSSSERCPICGEKIVREKFTQILFLFPYTFKTIRHYEKRHKDISKYARRIRLSFTLFMLLAIHSFAAAVASRNVEAMTNPQMPFIEVIPYFLVPYLSIQTIVWSSLAYLLLWKKGAIFERKIKKHF